MQPRGSRFDSCPVVHSKEMPMDLRLELLCGATNVDPGHPGFFEFDGINPHPKHAEVKAWADEAGITCSVSASTEHGEHFSDAYLYFEAWRVPEVVAALNRIDFPADILDVPEGLNAEDKELATELAESQGWTVETY